MRIAEGVARSKGVLRGERISHGWWGLSSSRKGRSTLKSVNGSSASSNLTIADHDEPKSKAPCLDIDTEECCACFGHYCDDIGTGREWLVVDGYTKIVLKMLCMILMERKSYAHYVCQSSNLVRCVLAQKMHLIFICNPFINILL